MSLKKTHGLQLKLLSVVALIIGFVALWATVNSGAPIIGMAVMAVACAITFYSC